MEIRLMCEEDVPAIRELEELCFADAWSEALLLQGLGSRLDTSWMLEEDGKICDYANLRVIVGEGEVERITVHPDFRGRGFGKKLVEQVVSSDRMQGMTDMTLKVRAGNKTAIEPYASCNFQKEAIRRGYYREPVEDAIVMQNRGV